MASVVEDCEREDDLREVGFRVTGLVGERQARARECGDRKSKDRAGSVRVDLS